MVKMATSMAFSALVIGLALLSLSARPLAQSSKCSTSIYDAVSATPELAQLKVAIDLAGLADTLSNKDLAVTVAAPNNKAFGDLVALLASVNVSLADISTPENNLVASVLLYHVFPFPVPSSALVDEEVLPTLLGAGYNVTVDLTSGVTFVAIGNSAKVVKADIEVCESVVHIIDTVMLPGGLEDIPPYQPTPGGAEPAPAPSGGEDPPPEEGGSTPEYPPEYPPEESPPYASEPPPYVADPPPYAEEPPYYSPPYHSPDPSPPPQIATIEVICERNQGWKYSLCACAKRYVGENVTIK